MDVWFYHLQSQPLARALPALVEKAVARGWRVIIQTVDDMRQQALDDHLWTYAPESFLPHGLARDKNPERHPILVTKDSGNPNGANMRIFVEGAEFDLGCSEPYERVILMFDGRNEAEIDAARRQWARLKAENWTLAYWQQSEEGRWDRRM